MDFEKYDTTQDFKEKKTIGESCCTVHVTIGTEEKCYKTESQKFLKHISNILWVFFILALLFSHSVTLAAVLLISAIICEEFD